MAGYKETPRQKMIGMMYLVLTALLALNVSVELLNAFLVVNESMETTNKTFTTKVDNLYNSFEKAYLQNPGKVGPFWEKAKEARKLSEDLKNFIIQTKFEALAFSDKITVEEAKQKPLREFKTKDKYDETTVFFTGGSVDGSRGRARILRERIEQYKKDIVNILDPKYHDLVKLGLETQGEYYDANDKKQNWEMHNFYHTILAADVVILNKLIAEVTNAEIDVVNILQSSISAEDFKFDEVSAAVVPKSQYIFIGENYEAEVFVTALDTKQNFTASIGGRTVSSELGKAKISIPGSKEGPANFKGNVTVKSPSGELKNYPIEIEYIVAPPTISISPTKMNVFYIGVENPVSISAGGVSDAQINASISQGSIKRSTQGWVAEVTTPGKASVTVSANVGGKTKPLGSFDFRVKIVPSPTAVIANTDGGVVNRDVVIAAGALIPRMPPDFDFDLNFIITSFQFSGNRKGDIIDYKGTGNRLTEDMKNFIKGCRRGEKVLFEEIYAKGPDGKNRKLNSIVLTIQ